jgi:excisionase family DNA binding protein
MTTMTQIFVSITEAAHMLGVGRSKLYELLGSGELQSVKLGTRRLVRVASVRDFSATLSQSGASKTASN